MISEKSTTHKEAGANLKPATCKRCAEKYSPYTEFNLVNKRVVAGLCDGCADQAVKPD